MAKIADRLRAFGRSLNPIPSAEGMVLDAENLGPAELMEIRDSIKAKRNHPDYFFDPQLGSIGKEISDQGAKINKFGMQGLKKPMLMKLSEVDKPRIRQLKDVFSHPELYQRTEFGETPVVNKTDNPNILGSFNPTQEFQGSVYPEHYTLNTDRGDVRETLIHEGQHQADFQSENARNKFLSGPEVVAGSPEYMVDPFETRARTTEQRGTFSNLDRERFPYVEHLNFERERSAIPQADVVPSSGSTQEVELLINKLRELGYDKGSEEELARRIFGINEPLGKPGDYPDQPGKQRHWRSGASGRTYAEILREQGRN
jgi:hypothetical protein